LSQISRLARANKAKVPVLLNRENLTQVSPNAKETLTNTELKRHQRKLIDATLDFGSYKWYGGLKEP